jgi:hypothetical protein
VFELMTSLHTKTKMKNPMGHIKKDGEGMHVIKNSVNRQKNLRKNIGKQFHLQ